MLRRLRKLLAFALVASVCVLGAGQEAASATYGAWAEADVHVVIGGGTHDFDCRASFRFQTIVTTNYLDEASLGRCIGGPDYTPGFCGIGEVGCTDFWWTFEGPGCSSITMLPIVGSSSADNTAHVAFGLGAYQTAAGSCDPTEVCGHIEFDGTGPDQSGVGCAPIALDPPTFTATTCPYGSVTSGWYVDIEQQGDTHETSPIQSNFWYFLGGAEVSALTSGQWLFYFLYDPNGVTGTASYPPGSTPAVPTPGFTGVGAISGTGNTKIYAGSIAINSDLGNTQTWMPRSAKRADPNWPDGSYARTLPIGVGIVRRESYPGTLTSTGEIKMPAWSAATDSTYAGFVGVNDPSRCSFYWGTKIWNNASTVKDEPTGTVVISTDPTPPPDDPSPAPDPDDCGGFLDSLLCSVGWLKAIWERLGDIVDALLGLSFPDLSDLVDNILDGLSGLFVPDQAHVHDAFDELQADVDDSGLGDWSDAVDDAIPSVSASGCSGPTIDLTLPGDSGIGGWHPLNACSGAGATAASVSKTALSALVIVAGLFACVNAILTGFGYSVRSEPE